MKFINGYLARYLALVGLLLIVQMSGYLFASTSLLHMADLTSNFIWLFAKKEYFFTHVLALALALPPAIAGHWSGSRSRAAIGASIVSVAAGIGLVAASWGQSVSTGAFATIDSYEMTLTNPQLMFAHAIHFQPVTVTLGLVGLIVLTMAGSWYLFRVGEIQRHLAARACALTLILSAMLANWTTIAGPKVGIDDPRGFHSSTFGQVMVVQDFLEQCYQSHTGPLTAFYCNWANKLSLADDLNPHPDARVVQTPLTTPEAWAEGAQPTRQSNVLFLVVESLRGDVIHDAKGFRSIMPNVAALAENGAFFENHYALATHSNYADIVPISSQYPLRSPNTHVYPERPTYPTPRIYDLLKTQGYRTAIISSQNEEWGKMANYLSSPSLDYFFHSVTFEGETYVPKNDIGFFSMAGNGKRSGKIDDYFTVNEAIDWIGQDADTPFYVYSNYQNSHFPYEVPEGFPRPFAPEPFDIEVGFNNVPDAHLDIVRRRYYDSLYYIDFQIGRLIQSLKDSGRFHDTLIIVTGDTGQAFREHGFSGHANMLFDETLRTPLIVHGPGIAPEIVTERYSHLDVPPTILSHLGLPPYPGFQGIDALNRDAYDPNRLVYLTVQSPFAHQYGVLLKNVKYFVDAMTGAEYLFQIDIDPGEKVNLAHAAPDFAAQLRQLVDSWRLGQLSYYADLKAQATTFPPFIHLEVPAPASNETEQTQPQVTVAAQRSQ